MDNALKKLQKKKKTNSFGPFFRTLFTQNALLRALLWQIRNILEYLSSKKPPKISFLLLQPVINDTSLERE